MPRRWLASRCLTASFPMGQPWKSPMRPAFLWTRPIRSRLIPLTAGPWVVLTVGVDPPTVGIANPGFGTVGVGTSFGTVVEVAGGGFGTVTVGGGGGFGRVTVGIGSGKVGVVTVVVVTPGIGTLIARARPERRPIAANPTRTAAALMSG